MKNLIWFWNLLKLIQNKTFYYQVYMHFEEVTSSPSCKNHNLTILRFSKNLPLQYRCYEELQLILGGQCLGFVESCGVMVTLWININSKCTNPHFVWFCGIWCDQEVELKNWLILESYELEYFHDSCPCVKSQGTHPRFIRFCNVVQKSLFNTLQAFGGTSQMLIINSESISM